MASPGVRGPALLAAAALAGLVVSLVLIYTVERRAAIVTVPVLVASRPIAKGTALDATMVKVVDWPLHLKGFGATASLDEAVGRLARADLYAGEPVLNEKLRRRGERGDLSDQLGVGERALSVRVNDIVGIPVGDLQGRHVDLLQTPRDGDIGTTNAPIVERARVLAVNDTGTPDRPQPIRMLTLAVSPEQAAAIERVRSAGPLTALIRNPRDARVTMPSTAPVAKFEPAPAQAPVELMLGTETVRP